MKLDEGAPLLGPKLDRARAVREGVVHEVHERLADAQRVGMDVQAALADSKLAAERARPARESRRGVCEQVIHGNGLLPDRQRPLVGAGDQQEIFGEPGQALRLVGRGAQRALKLLARSRATECEVELRAKQRERGAELVAGVGDEAALVLDSRLQAREHLVQRPGEAGDLVPGGRHGQPARLARIDGFRASAQELDRSERSRRECVPAK